MAAIERKYANISFEEIRAHLLSILRAKEGPLADLGDSSYGKTLIELFAGFGDLTANWIESAFENVWLETAYAKAPVYAGSRSIGYSIRRPVPAKCSIGIRVTTIDEHADLRVFIPKGTQFSMAGTTLTAMSDMVFDYDYDSDADQTGLMELVNGYNVLAEGFVRTAVLSSNGKQNQVLHITDPTFSDYFGENDPNYSDDGNVAHRPACFTTVSSDATLLDNVDPAVVIDDKLYWRISRRGLEDPALEDGGNDIARFSEPQSNYSENYTVVIDTANDGTVALHFGDGLKAAIPFGNILVKYFSTNGEDGNRLGVFGTALSASGTGITITTRDGQETNVRLTDLNICLTTDIRGGLNIESIDSIRNNAPGIYSSLDRLVNRESYKIFLRRYADVKYASAFGEEVLKTKLPGGGINVKYMNQVRFTALKDLYREKDGKYYPTGDDEYFLSGYKVNGLMYNWLYDYQDVGDISYSDGLKLVTELSKRMPSVLVPLLKKYLPSCNPDDTEIKGIASGIIKEISNSVPLVDFSDKVFSAFLTPLDFVEPGSELYDIMIALNRRGMLTVGDGFHNYVYPSVHNMEMEMDVVLFKGNNFNDIRERIQKVVYKYLKDNTEFGTPIYRSKIESLVHTMTEVAGVDVRFKAADDSFKDFDLADYPWMGDAVSAYTQMGSATPTGVTFSLTSTYDGVRTTTTYDIGDQAVIASNIANYYAQYVKGADNVTDLVIDHFVAFIWENVMQEIYKPIVDEFNIEVGMGRPDNASRQRGILENMKTWDMVKDSLSFKDSGTVVDMSEVDGTGLFDYMRYAMDYIKFVRRVLGSKATSALIDKDTGNILHYTNDNEIVQFVIPGESINLRVAQENSLLTGTGISR